MCCACSESVVPFVLGESSPEGLPVNLPDLQIGPVKLPAINSTLPKKQESGMPGRKRLQEVATGRPHGDVRGFVEIVKIE